jgi:hypothetical protein
MNELNRLKKQIQDGINNKITGKCNVTIIDNTLIIDIASKHLTEAIIRIIYTNIYEDIQQGLTSTVYINQTLKEYKLQIYRRFFKKPIDKNV